MNSYDYAFRMLRRYGLHNWNFVIKDYGNETWLGLCEYCSNTISINSQVAKHGTFRTVKNIILHEIAHAVLGPGFEHGTIFHDTAVSMGCEFPFATCNPEYQELLNDCNHPFILKYRDFYDNIDDMCYALNKRYGLGTKYWYEAYLKINETNQEFVV